MRQRFFFFNDTATTEIYTLSLHALFRSRKSDFPRAIGGSFHPLRTTVKGYFNLFKRIGRASENQRLPGLHYHSIAIKLVHAQATVVSREGGIDGLREIFGSFGIGMERIGEEIGTMTEG